MVEIQMAWPELSPHHRTEGSELCRSCPPAPLLNFIHYLLLLDILKKKYYVCMILGLKTDFFSPPER